MTQWVDYGAIDFDFLVDAGVIDIEDRNLIGCAETAQDVREGLQYSYERNDEPLLEEKP